MFLFILWSCALIAATVFLFMAINEYQNSDRAYKEMKKIVTLYIVTTFIFLFITAALTFALFKV